MNAPIPALSPVEAIAENAGRTGDSPAMQQLTLKFEALMKDGGAHAAMPFTDPAQPNALLRAASAQEDMLKQTFRELDGFAARSQDMSNAEFVAEHIRLSNHLAVSALQFSFATHAAQDANKSLQTLLKNQ